MVARALVVVALLAVAGGYTARAGDTDVAVSRQPLRTLSTNIDGWQGFEAAPFSDDVVAQLGVDDHINRRYVHGGLPVTVYVGYYNSQRQGDTIHSPRNCLPGAGWQPVSFERATIQAGGASIPVNRYLIEKGLDRQAVIYWYQGRGRSVANEYANKAWLMLDAARLRRTDGALVRMIAPVTDSTAGAFDQLTAFAAAFYPLTQGSRAMTYRLGCGAAAIAADAAAGSGLLRRSGREGAQVRRERRRLRREEQPRRSDHPVSQRASKRDRSGPSRTTNWRRPTRRQATTSMPTASTRVPQIWSRRTTMRRYEPARCSWSPASSTPRGREPSWR